MKERSWQRRKRTGEGVKVPGRFSFHRQKWGQVPRVTDVTHTCGSAWDCTGQ